jgi:hypothetical protein
MSNSFGGSGRGSSLLRAIQSLHSGLISTLVNAHVFDVADESLTSSSVDVSGYGLFSLLLALTVSGAPTDIVIRVQLSDNDSDFYTLMNGPFGDLRFEDSAGNKSEALVSVLSANFLRLHVVSSGCSAGNTFTLTGKLVASV